MLFTLNVVIMDIYYVIALSFIFCMSSVCYLFLHTRHVHVCVLDLIPLGFVDPVMFFLIHNNKKQASSMMQYILNNLSTFIFRQNSVSYISC